MLNKKSIRGLILALAVTGLVIFGVILPEFSGEPESVAQKTALETIRSDVDLGAKLELLKSGNKDDALNALEYLKWNGLEAHIIHGVDNKNVYVQYQTVTALEGSTDKAIALKLNNRLLDLLRGMPDGNVVLYMDQFRKSINIISLAFDIPSQTLAGSFTMEDLEKFVNEVKLKAEPKT